MAPTPLKALRIALNTIGYYSHKVLFKGYSHCFDSRREACAKKDPRPREGDGGTPG